MMGIYKIENIVTNDIYIGSALDFQKRKWLHQHKLRKNKHHSPILQNSWNKHGEESFKFLIIEDVQNKEDLITREQYYIDTLKPKYNCSKTAGSPLGVKHTLQSRINMSNAHLGITLSPESIDKRTAKVLGSKRSNDTIKLMRESSPHKKKIEQYDLNGKFIREWVSIGEARKTLKIGHISGCCTGKRKTSGGFIWKYQKDYLSLQKNKDEDPYSDRKLFRG